MENLSQEEWKERLESDKDSKILDVRTEQEFSEGYIPNATNIDIHKGQGFIDEVNKLDKSKNYYVYCRSGGRSAQAATLMNQHGFENTYNLMGGITEWNGEIEQ